MSLYHKGFQTDKRRTAYFVCIEIFFYITERFYQHRRSDFISALGNFGLDDVHQCFAQAFGEFQNGIAHKAVADNDICFPERNISRLNIAHKIQIRYFQKLISLFCQAITFFLFGTNIHQCNRRIFLAKYVFYINGTHFAKLFQIFCFTVYVCTAVYQEGKAILCRQASTQYGTFYARQTTYNEQRACQEGTSTAGGNKGVCLPIFHQLHTHNHRGIFLFANCHSRHFISADDFFCIDHFDFFFWICIFCQFPIDIFFSAYQFYQHIHFFDCIHSTFDGFHRCQVPAHGIQCNDYFLIHNSP